MKDAYVVFGEQIEYQNETYTIGDFYFVPDNPNIFVQLRKNGCSLNVRLDDVKHLITSIPKPFFMTTSGNTH
jgi:hypothetical protein